MDWAWVGVAVGTAVVGWVLTRTLSVPGRVSALEQGARAFADKVADTYVRKVGTVDDPGFMALAARVQRLESAGEFAQQSASAEHSQILATQRLILDEVQACRRVLARHDSGG